MIELTRIKMKKAFTLVELLVVIAIMAILTIVTVSQFRTARKRANDVARKGDLNAVAKALQLYFADYGVMPDMDTSGQIKVGTVVKSWGSEFTDGANPPYVYMVKLPIENTVGWPQYCYKTDTAKKKYALFAKLEVESDGECKDVNGDGVGDYSCGGVPGYCYANVSPNTSLNSNGDFL